MDKRMTAREALSRIQTGDTLLIGGFQQGGSPEYLLEVLVAMEDAFDLSVVSNDTGGKHQQLYRLMEQNRVRHVTATYIGSNPKTQRLYLDGAVTLLPEGTLAEALRAGGAGIPAFLTDVGIGTAMAANKPLLMLSGTPYLLQEALRGDVALVHAKQADAHGNCYMRGTSNNLNALMPAAAKYAIVEAEELVPVGEIDPDRMTVSGVFIDAVVQLPKTGEARNG